MYPQQSQERYKSISSEEATRNPTTNKKGIFYTPVQKKSQKRHYNEPDRVLQENSGWNKKTKKKRSQSLYNSMNQLQAKKNKLLRSSRYEQAKQVNSVIEYLQRKRAKTQIKGVYQQHTNQKKIIKKAHLQQMQVFQRAWQYYFHGLRQKQQFTLIHFKSRQQGQISRVQKMLITKCKSLHINKGRIVGLERVQKSLIKQQKYSQLMVARGQKQRLVTLYNQEQKQQLLREQQEKIYNWAKTQESSLKVSHTKRYSALMSRIEEMHNDKYRQYQRESCRLKQKYHNVLKKLGHQQKMEINQTLQKYTINRFNPAQRQFTLHM